MNPTKPPPLLWGGDLEVGTLEIHSPRQPGVMLAADDRRALLERVRGGESIELQFVARTFIQRATPNRNFIRIAPKALAALARSYKGAPFLRDHNQRDLASRGGTVLDCTLERGDDSVAFVQTVALTKPWAVEGLLDGTIDRFSIGFHPTGPVNCSVHKTPVFRDCSCYPGQAVSKDSDERVEFVLSSAEGVEVSAVNVPAVVGTGVDDIRAALAASEINWGGSPAQEGTMIRLLARLGLGEGASEEQALAVYDKQAVEAEATKERLRLSEGKLAEYQLERQRDQAQRLDADIERLYQQGKLPLERDASGKRVQGVLEQHLRSMFSTLGYDAFADYAAKMPPTFGPGALQSGAIPLAGAPAPSAAPVSARPIDQAALRLNVPPDVMRETLAQLGLDDDIVARCGPKQGV